MPLGTPRAVRLGLALVLSAVLAEAGPWSRLPDAVSRLQVAPDDPRAGAVLADVEASVIAEAAAGRLASTATLAEVYAGLVSPLVEGEVRLETLEGRVAAALIAWGDARVGRDPENAARAWALAARLAPSDEASARLRPLLVPPSEAAAGDVWRSPVDGAELVALPRFRFRMGCTVYDRECGPEESTRRWLVVAPFWIDRAEVTVERYRRCVESGGCTPPGSDAGLSRPAREDEPVTGVSWYQAQAYATWAGRRLPTESEWERAARGDRTDRRYPWGNFAESERANVAGTAGADQYERTAPAGTFPATGWGLLDLAGNVREWCRDAFTADLDGAPIDGGPVLEGQGRVVRGGSWRLAIGRARVSAREGVAPTEQADDLGFRCALDSDRQTNPGEVAALAAAAFPVRSEAPTDLLSPALDAADRRYLLRRAVTWLTLEGRFLDALPYALELERREARDRVAAGLFDRVEGDLTTAASALGPADRLADQVETYRRALVSVTTLGRRRARFEQRLAQALARSGEQLRRAGDLRSAEARFRLALRLDPDNAEVQRLSAAILPSPGAVRVWDEDGREMAWIPSGTFQMGTSPGDGDAAPDEMPVRVIRVEGFWIDRTEVTNSAYRRCVEAGACTPPYRRQHYDDPGSGDLPVLWVDWYQARAYARWAGKRLPSEAEWERAARSGAPTRYPWGQTWRDGRANISGRRGADRWAGAAPVASFPVGAWGVFDLLGNAAEWTEDAYWQNLDEVPADGTAVTQIRAGFTPSERVIRGGSYRDLPAALRVSRRQHRTPTSWLRTVGFRCAADP